MTAPWEAGTSSGDCVALDGPAAHMGSRNALLCQLTADATGLPVAAGPAEGTALGNLLVQARAVGALSGGLDALRRVAVASSEVTQYAPGALGIPPQRWSRAAARLRRDGS